MQNIATEFKLWESSRDPGAWVLYGARYSAEQLRLKQEQVIGILEGRVVFQDTGDAIGVKSIDGSLVEPSTLALLEELACINEALDLHANQPDIAGRGLTPVLEYNPVMSITRESVSPRNLADLYNEIDIGW